MKKITQTGYIPISSIGLILWNYLRWFKVFLVFYMLPTVIFFAIGYFTNKEKILAVLNNFVAFWTAMKMFAGNQAVLQSAGASLQSSINALTHSASYIILSVSGFIVMIICYTCMFVGFKHAFYEKISITKIMKEGFDKILNLIWTFLSLIILVFFVVLACLLIIIPMGMVLGDSSQYIILPIAIVMFLIFYSMFAFYVPIHLFSDNNPFSAMAFSFKTFWNSLGFIIVFALLRTVIFVVISVIIAGVAYLIIHHYYPMIPSVMLIILIAQGLIPLVYTLFPYIGSLATIGLNTMSVFIAYPELLAEDDLGSNTSEPSGSLEFSGSSNGSPSLPPEFFNNQNTNNSSQQNINNSYENNSGITPSTGGEGLSKPMTSRQNNRPFLNERIGETMFERLTSKTQDNPTPNIPQASDTPSDSAPKME